MATNFHLAPPAKTVDGLLAVAIDIVSITASFVFDAAAQTAVADATITYEVGPTAGNPIFDLRQTITQAWLDGAVFPVAQLAHHGFGSGAFTDLRVLEAVQSAGSVHTLRVIYNLALPNSQLGGSYLPVIEWTAGPRLRFVFGLSDLNRARYVEAWLPANLPFDQYSITLAVQITGTLALHSVISNGVVTALGVNQWAVAFPARFTCLSPMFEIRAADSLVQQSGAVLLPSGATVSIDTWKPAASTVNLATQITAIGNLLADNETAYGGYAHGNRFAAFFNGTGGMEYEGGTTTSTGALLHETFHSWFARGIKPASQADGWWDEGYTSYHDNGADDPLPFDYSAPPVLLCSRDPWQRHTPSNAYSDGQRFWQGLASLLGVDTLNNLMAQLYGQFKGQPVSTQHIEEFLLRQSGNVQVVDAFHRFVYGLADSGTPDLWLRDDPAHAGGDAWGGAFWDSPDLWVRNADDNGTAHQSPEFGQDNWLFARVRNRSASAAAQHFAVSFHARGFAGTQFSYPADFLPSVAARAEFDLSPGATRIVKARWPRAAVPAPGTHTCLLAAVLTRGDHPVAGRHVWEHNNLAQKNLTVVDMVPGEFFILPVVIAHHLRELGPWFELEVWRPKGAEGLEISLLNRSAEFFRHTQGGKPRRFDFQPGKHDTVHEHVELECGAHLAIAGPGSKGLPLTSANPQGVQRAFGDAWQLLLASQPRTSLPVQLLASGQHTVGLMVQVARDAPAGRRHRLHLVQRDQASGKLVGGVALALHVVQDTDCRNDLPGTPTSRAN